MLVVGLFAVLSWDSTFPDRRDVLVLAPLPLRARTMFLAKVAAVATALALTVLTMHSLAGLAWPLALSRTIPAAARMTVLHHGSRDGAVGSGGSAGAARSRYSRPAQTLRAGFLAPGAQAGVSHRRGETRHTASVYVRDGEAGFAVRDRLDIEDLHGADSGADGGAGESASRSSRCASCCPTGTVGKPAGGEITLLDLATHHSGLPRMPGNLHPADRGNPFADYHAADLYAYLKKHGVAKDGEAQFLYSNLGFGLLGQALANRAGIPCPNWCETRSPGRCS